MTRFCLLFFYSLSLNSVFGQTINDTTTHTASVKIIKEDSIKLFISSLKLSILNDTSKFDPKDLFNINGRTENRKSYSFLYSVDNKYYYKLDNINGVLVNEFLNEILNPSKIKSIDVLSEKKSMLIFGDDGKNGCIIISTKRKSKLNYKIAGLKYNKRSKTGDNFDQRKKGEPYIMIRT